MIAQSFASLYRIYPLKNNLSFVSNRTSSMIATSFNFSWELSPSRYFITKEEDAKWESGATLWQLYNYDFNPGGGPLINSSKGTSWNNNYPLMVFPVSKTALKAGGYEFENFIFDYSTTTTESNVDNQTVVVYNIDMNNGNGSNTLGWSDFVKIDLV